MIRWAVVVAVTLVAVPACSGDDGEGIRVMAASSLTDVFADMAAAFEEESGTTVEVVTGASSTLATQLAEGAPADVVALADPVTMIRVVDAGRVGARQPQIFASNHLVLAVPAGNPAGITGIDDLAGRVLAVCAPAVPCGALTQTLAQVSGVTLEPTTSEPNVRAVLTKLELDEVDAGFVYVTDVTEGVDVVPVMAADQVRTSYPIAALDEQSSAALAFVDFVQSTDGQRILADHGFGEP